MPNHDLFLEASNYLVGGVNSPRRKIEPYPFFTKKAKGAYLWDADGKMYIDYCLGYGPLVLGHAHERVVEAIKAQAELGTMYGTPTELEIMFAKKVVSNVPNVDMIRCVNSGTEATMAAVRLARGITGREKILIFNGGYHGTHDNVLIRGDVASRPAPICRGIPKGTASNTVLAEFNDIGSVEKALSDGSVAALLMEPVMCDQGCVIPYADFLKGVRNLCTEHGTLLIFDEVITGFRMCMGGAQEYFGIDADLVTYGKIVGGGMPIGVVGGPRKHMENLAPLGEVYNAGTFNGNPMSMAAGHETIRMLEEGNVHPKLEKSTRLITNGLEDILPENSALNSLPGMFQFYLGVGSVENRKDVTRADKARFMDLQRALMERGVFLPPSNTETNFLSYCHDYEILEETLTIFEGAIKEVQGG